MNQETEQKLRLEVVIARKAQSAYDDYIQKFIALKREDIIDGFRRASVADVETIMKIKQLDIALTALEVAVKRDIETGKLAEKQLEEINK